MVDEIAARLYRWEDAFVDPRQRPGDKLLTSEQCVDYVFKACSLTNTKFPQIRFTKSTHVPCKANFRTWEIILAEWGRAALPVLHETAHLATYNEVMQGENPHGPSFARMVIDFYSIFMGIDKDYMLRTAEKSGVLVGQPRTPLILPSNESPFGDEVF